MNNIIWGITYNTKNMSASKKQHYLPQFYLKNFSTDGKQIYVYHCESKRAILSPINSTCQEKFFYENDPDFEKCLSEIESYLAKSIKKTIQTRNITDISIDDYYNLLVFVLLQNSRTKDAKMQVDNWADYFLEYQLKPLMKSHEKFKKYPPEAIDALRIKIPQFYKYTMGFALDSIELLFDLRSFLLINDTPKPFITSDAPILLNNYINIKNRNLIGLASQGLQIFCPLSDSLALLLIDEKPYNILPSSDTIISIRKESDVDTLNKAEILNCLELIIFKDLEEFDYINELFEECQNFKIKKSLTVKKLQTKTSSDGKKSEIIRLHTEGINYRHRFSFIKLNHEFHRKFQSEYNKMLKSYINLTPVRNKELCEKIKNRNKQLSKNP